MVPTLSPTSRASAAAKNAAPRAATMAFFNLPVTATSTSNTPRRVLLLELRLAGVAQRHRPALRARGEVVHHRLPGAQLVALVGDLHTLELLPVEAVRRLQRLVVLDADGQGVADSQRRRRRRHAHQREAGERHALHGDPHVAEGPAEDEDDDAHAGLEHHLFMDERFL